MRRWWGGCGRERCKEEGECGDVAAVETFETVAIIEASGCCCAHDRYGQVEAGKRVCISICMYMV